MPRKFQFSVPSRNKPSIHISDAGLYVRFQNGVKAAETLIRSEWPHVALDLAADGSVVGIECIPTPGQFTIETIANRAGVALPRMAAGDVMISSTTGAPQQSADLVAAN